MTIKPGDLIPFDLALTGRCIKSVDSTKLTFTEQGNSPAVLDNFTNLKNIKYTDNGVTGITEGMSKINTTAIPTYPKINTMFQFKKVQPAETHIIVQSYNAGETESKVFQNTTSIPNTGDFNGTELHTDATGAGSARMSDAPDEHFVYCNSKETMTWGGNETKLSSFEIYDEFADSFTFDFTEKVQNDLLDSNNIATTKKDSDTPAKTTLRIGNTLPIQGFNITIVTPNANVLDNAMSVFYWDGAAWAAVSSLVDGTITGSTPNEVSLGQTGSVTFTSTESTAKQRVINGVMGFYYKVEIIGVDNTTTMSQVTLAEPFQPLQDFWDGELRIGNSIQLFSDGIFKDNTVNTLKNEFVFNDETGGDKSSYMVMDELKTSSDYLVVGFLDRQQGLNIKMIPSRSNRSVASVGKVGLGSVSIGDRVTGITVNSVQIMSGEERAVIVNNAAMAKDVVGNINKHVSVPNYTAEADISLDGLIKITSVTRGTASNGYAVVTSEINLTSNDEDMSGGRDVASTLTIKYWSGSAWVTVGTVTDGTISDGASLGKSGFITWNAISENTEFKREINNEDPLFYYQLTWDDTFGTDCSCYHIAGIPVQNPVNNYKFPLLAQNRLWLFGEMSNNKNQAIKTNVNELNSFNGKGVGDPLRFGDKTEIVAATEIFERTSTSLESRILVLKEHSSHVIEGDNPENWRVINLVSNMGCNAPYTLSASTIGLEFAPLQRKQIAIWQGSSGIYMFDNSSIHPISDDISNFFDQRNDDAINLSKAHISQGFFEVQNGEHFWHWCFASGSSTTINKEWVLDIKRQKWFEIDRGTNKAIQGGGIVIDVVGNIYNYAFEAGGFIQRLNNGTTFDGNNINYEMEFGDTLPTGSMSVLTSLDSLRLMVVSKTNTSNSIKAYHYGDTRTVATLDKVANTNYYTLATNKTGQRVCMPFKNTNTAKHIVHRLKLTMSTNDETVGFEPLYVGGFYKHRGISKENLTN